MKYLETLTLPFPANSKTSYSNQNSNTNNLIFIEAVEHAEPSIC